jgi:hypothetical protein
MTIIRSLPAFFIVAVTTAVAAPDQTVDPSTLKEKVAIDIGKKIAVVFEAKGNTLSHPKVVKEPEDKRPTLSLDFRKQGDMIILITKNPFTKDLKFRALARQKGRKGYYETSIVPVKAGLLSFEVWPDPLEELVLFEFSLVDSQPQP